MNCRTLRRKSAWSCATNMCWDPNQAITFTTRGGERSRLSCAPPRDSHPSLLIQRPDTTHRHTEASKSFRRTGLPTACFLFAMLFAASGSFAQIPVATPPPPPPPGQESGTSPSGGRIRVDVNLVVLHTTGNDDRGKFVEGLSQDNFRVYEDKVEQELSLFKREDIRVSMGLVIDNSGSMRDKRHRGNEAALTLVHNSNPQNQSALVNVESK